jgi:hypothetical protein
MLDHKATVVNDFFAQCEKCKYWLRLRPLDETGYRTIPLRNCIKVDRIDVTEGDRKGGWYEHESNVWGLSAML